MNGVEYEEATYEGEFKAGKREGYGVMTWADGSSFSGVWKNDQRHEGEMSMANGFTYRGGFKDDKFSGQGMLLMQGRDYLIYQGEFNKGCYTPIGKLLFPNGDVYFGQFQDFVRQGVGKLIQLDGTIYEGGWEQDRKNGKGRLIDGASGDIFIGDFSDGKKQGRGILYSKANETIYDGDWSNDNKHGEGFVLHRNGRIDHGEFRGGVAEGKSHLKQVISVEEAERIFLLAMTQREAFIAIR